MSDGDQETWGSQPRVVGRYQIVREIGRGGMAIVYAAIQPDLDRQVALKELSRFHAGSAEFAHRFLRESRLAGSLNHPNIVTVHEYFEHAGTPYIAMEYVPRGSLRRYVKRMSLTQIVGVLEGVLAGLAHAESAGIVHRDLKPENIMVTADGRVKITDFGIARATERAGTQFMTATGMTVGTPTYMAPEQAMAGEIGPWTDLYSVGVMTYELVVGHVPFYDTQAPMVILMRHVNEDIPSPITVRADIDRGLSEWIDSLLTKDPRDRFRHATDAWESLEDIVVGLRGPLWRRNARLLEDQLAVLEAEPLTPAPFESQGPVRTPTPGPSPVPDEFVTFAPGSSPPSDTPSPEPASPPPEPPPASPEPASASPEPASSLSLHPAAPDEIAVGPPVVTTGFIQLGSEPPPAQEAEVSLSGLASEAPLTVEEPPRVEEAEPGTAGVQAGDHAPTEVGPPDELVDEPPPAAVDEFVTFGRQVKPASPSPAKLPAAAPPAPAAATPSDVTPESVPAAAEPEPEPIAELPPLAEPSTATEPGEGSPSQPPPEPQASATGERISAVFPIEPAAIATAEAARPARKAPIGILAAIVGVAAAVVGFVVAPSSGGGRSRPVALTQSATAGPLRVLFPAGWRTSTTIPSGVAPLRLSDAVTLSAGASAPGGELVLGTMTAQGEPVLPTTFTASLTASPQGYPVKLGSPSQTFMRYPDLHPKGAAPAESVYALPTESGTATAVCILPQSNATAFAATCEQVVGSLTTTGKVLPLTANLAYAQALDAIVAKLNAAVAASSEKLATATDQRSQAAAAIALGHAYRQTASAAEKLTPGPSAGAANAAIVSASRRLAAAYTRLSSGAAHNDARAYVGARATIKREESALGAAYRRLAENGYTVG